MNSFLKLIKGLITKQKNKIKDSVPFKLLVSYCLKEISIDEFEIYIFFPLIQDLIKEGYSLDENGINDLIKYFNLIVSTEVNESFHLNKIIKKILIISVAKLSNWI